MTPAEKAEELVGYALAVASDVGCAKEALRRAEETRDLARPIERPRAVAAVRRAKAELARAESALARCRARLLAAVTGGFS